MNKSKIPTIIGIIVLIVGVAAGVLLVNNQQLFRLGASPDIAPQDVRVTNVTDSSFSITWITDKQVQGFVNWGSDSQLGNVANSDSQSPEYVHLVNIRGLSPSKTYYFEISSQGKKFDNSGIPWQVQTGPLLSPPTNSRIISGTIFAQNNEPASDTVVFLNSGGVAPLSAKTSANGSYVISLSNARTTSLSSYAQIDKNTTLLEIFVQAGPLGVATAQVYPANANPAPTIILGQSHDFRNKLPEESKSQTTSTLSSKFEVAEQKSQESGSVTLDSVTEGETIFTTNPEFFGEGPPNTSITITIESDNPISEEVKVTSIGTWKWSPDETLGEGNHKITISWKDLEGVLKTLTRSFVVHAQEEEPAFESTPSGATPTPFPSPTATATPTPTDRVSIPSTDSGVPDAGTPIPTIILAGAGLILMTIGVYISKKASAY